MSHETTAHTNSGMGLTLGVLAIVATVGIYLLTRKKSDGSSHLDDIVNVCERAAESLERSLLAESA